MAPRDTSVDNIAEKLFQKLSNSRRRPFAPSKDEDKPGDGLWNAYLDAVEDEDRASAESWNGSTAGILTFVRSCVDRDLCNAFVLMRVFVDWSFRGYSGRICHREL